MERVISRGHLVSVLLSIVALITVYFIFGEKPNSAQERPERPLTAKFEQFAKADDITSAVRDRKKEIVRVQFHTIADRENVTKFGRIVQDFGSSVVLAKNTSADMSRSGLDVQRIETTINLPGARFEPVQTDAPDTVRAGETGRSGKGYYIVQFGGIATDEWLDSIRDAGVEVVQYVPHQAFFVYGDRSAMAKIAGHSRVRWVGGYNGEQKLPKETKDFAAKPDQRAALFDVAVFSRADLAVVSASVEGRVASHSMLANNFFNVLRVELTPSQVSKVADLPDVFRIDPYTRPTKEDERAAQIVAGNYTSTTSIAAPGYNPLAQFGVDGSGVTVMVSDDGISIPGNGGFYITSSNTIDGPLRGAAAGATGGHGHINASIIAGNTPFGILDGLGYNYGLGVAPKGNIINIPFLLTTNTTTDAQAVDDALNTLGPNGARGTISNNSWGAGANGNSYDSLAAQYDGLVRDGSLAPTIDPFSIIFSAGNCGNSPASSACSSQNGLTRPKISKNTIAVANSENIRTEFSPSGANNMDDLTSSSSRGPAADGRIKPDITAPGTVITGSRAGTCGSVSSCFDANHAWSTGTSHAAPQVAGAAALFTQYWRNDHAGVSPNPSLIKAAIINSAQEMNGVTTNLLPIPNGNEGWGRINMKLMMNTGVSTQYVNEELVFSNPGVGQGIIGTVADATKPVRITLVWTDPPGAGDPALVNNLDLQVNVGGTLYKGNVFTSGSSTSGGAADTLNNVENVWLPAGIPAGTFFSVMVSSVALNGDGVLGNADTTDQHFSLVAYNMAALTAPDVRPPVDFDGDDKSDISIFREDMHRWWVYRSSDNAVFGTALGAIDQPGMPLPADYTGDGKADVVVWRPTDGTWFIQRSEDFTYFTTPFGMSGDVPVPGDYDGDSKADRAVYRTSTGTWFIQKSSGGVDTIPFGVTTDRPVPADYDGDGKIDIAIFRPSTGQWWINRSTAGVIVLTFGLSTDKQVHGDYTGDGKADVAVWRPSTGEWFVLRSEDFSYFSVPFGSPGDLPAPGDYDGDDKFDTAVYRPSTATWFVNRSTAGIHIQNFGLSADIPLPNVYVR